MRKYYITIIVILGIILTTLIYFRLKPEPQAVSGSNNLNTTSSSTVVIASTTTPTTSPTVSTPPHPPRADGADTPMPTPASSTPTTTPSPTHPPSALLWGSYVGDNISDLDNFESLVGKRVDIYAYFSDWETDFPSHLKTKIGGAGKTLLIFWEPSFGYDNINSGDKDDYVKSFAADANAYGFPVIMAPFAEPNLNEEAWGYAQNGNTAKKFKEAWIRTRDLFAGVKNVKFGLAYNFVSIPDIPGNRYADYYPGAAYVDYVGVDGFNFGDPWQTFGEVFDGPMKTLATFNKPIYIFSLGSIAGTGKAAWITDGLGDEVKRYKNVVGWVWFHDNKVEDGRWIDWRVNSDADSLRAFKSILP